MNSVSSSTPAESSLVLCIDDGEIALRIRQMLLNSAVYLVLAAKSGEIGLELFKKYPIGLVVSDHFLSGKTGTEIAKEMEELKPDVPILILSGAIDRPEGLEFADEFLMKCEPPEVLLHTIALLLAK
jgi:response regulator RpfG family c-di-GMP phosphodiesterase